MNILGLDALVFGVDDIQACSDCLRDYGLTPVALDPQGGRFEALDGTAIIIRPADHPQLPPAIGPAPSLRETVYGVADAATLDAIGQEHARAGLEYALYRLQPSATRPPWVADGRRYRWEFERQGVTERVNVSGPITLTDQPLMVDAAVDGIGIAFVPEHLALEPLADGRLLRLLEDWCPEFPGLSLYYPGHRHVPPGLKALIGLLQQQVGSRQPA